MNPTDPLELSSFNERLLDIIPIQTEKTLNVPFTFGHIPKNLKEYSNDKFIKTLDKYQHVLEEIQHRDNDNIYSKSFIHYTRKYFNECIGHDSNSFFKNHITPDLRDNRNIGRQHNNPFFFTNPLNGPEIIIGGTGINATLTGTRAWAQSGTGTVNHIYNEIAFDVVSGSTGNVNYGIYSDSSGPNSLLGSTGSTACPANSSFTYISTTGDTTLTTTTTWVVVFASSSSVNFNSANVSTPHYKDGLTFPTLPNPFAETGTSSGAYHCKINHT